MWIIRKLPCNIPLIISKTPISATNTCQYKPEVNPDKEVFSEIILYRVRSCVFVQRISNLIKHFLSTQLNKNFYLHNVVVDREYSKQVSSAIR